MRASRCSVIGLVLLVGLAYGRNPSREQSRRSPPEKARSVSFADAPRQGEKQASGTAHALLVGCTRYDNLEPRYQLRGPANDVVLMRDFLLKRGFRQENIVVLSEAGGAKSRPTKAHIKAEFERLARVVRAGDLVLIHMAGHGSQQPVPDPDDPDNYEPDGLDETFLPADVSRGWDDKAKTVPNAITDNEVGAWLKAIRARKASVVLIVDACHSASMARDPEEMDRRVEVEKLVPARAIREAGKAARKRAEKARGAAPPAPFKMRSQVPDLVALYAAQRTETTVERRFPADSPDAKHYGLFTYTLIQVVTQASSPMTYRELVERIHARYVGAGRSSPTPLVEGKDRDNEFLNTAGAGGRPPRRPTYLLKRVEDGWKVDGGTLHGLTKGSILTVYPPAGEANADKPLGHVCVTGPRVLEAFVEPCAFEKMPVPRQLPKGGRCQLAYVDYGEQKLRVAVQLAARGDDPKRAERDRELRQTLQKLSKDRNTLVKMVKDPRAADWLVVEQKEKMALAPAAEWRRGAGAVAARFVGPVAGAEARERWLKQSLNRVARARNLVALASAGADTRALGGTTPDVKLELLRYPDGLPTAKPKVVRWGTTGIEVQAGDWVAFQLTNRGREPIDVTLLFVDSDYGISSIFPEAGVTTDNRLLPGKDLKTPRLTVNAKTLGLEHVVLIAVRVKRDEQPVDFSCLEQPSILTARKIDNKGTALDSPLGRLFQHAFYGAGDRRGMTRSVAANYTMQSLSWNTSRRTPAKP